MDYLSLRLISAFFSGLILSQSGSLIQIGTRNILASPSTLGIEGLSVLWILTLHSLFLFFGVNGEWVVYGGIPFFILLGHFLSGFSGREHRMERVLFAGLTFNLLVGAVFSLWQFFFMAYNLPFPMEVWFGNFRYSELRAVAFLISFEAIFAVFAMKIWNQLELYSLGPSVSRAHKVDLRKLFSLLFTFSFVGTFLVISFFGAFSFLGILFPILGRKIWFRSQDLKGEIFFGAISNGFIFMLVDFACYRFPVMGAEIPVGLIASVIGALCLIAIVVRGRSGPEFLAKPRK